MTTYLFEEEPMTCVSLETELGLGRGDISRLIIYPSGAVEIETRLTLSVSNEAKLKGILTRQGLSRGKKVAN